MTITCYHSSAEVDVNNTGGEGCQDHAKRGKKATHYHHRATTKAIYQNTAQGACQTKQSPISLCVVVICY